MGTIQLYTKLSKFPVPKLANNSQKQKTTFSSYGHQNAKYFKKPGPYVWIYS